MSKNVGAVLVVGAGVSGIQSALDLADSGFKVYLIDRRASIGGTMAQLDKTFPTNDCSMCILAPKLVAAGRHPNIQLLTLTDVVGIEGGPGNFKVSLHQRARYVDMDKCVGCGLCAEKCPQKVPNEFDEGLRIRKAIYVAYPQAVPLKYAIDERYCLKLTKGKCGICQKVCPSKAPNYEDKPKDLVVDVGSVILAPGFDEFDAHRKAEYGYGHVKNVVTSIEFERIMSASGPFDGHIKRLSDGKDPKKLAFVQCVGSRDSSCGNEYCSSVCCMYSIKEAMIAKEHSPDIEPEIFFMDIRAFGKEFDDYYTRAQHEHGIKFIRCRVASIAQSPGDKVLITYEDAGQIQRREFDMAVLAVGLESPAGVEGLAKAIGITLDKNRFASTDVFSPLQTNKPGVYVCGAFAGPKDIPDTVAQASAAASKASTIVASARGTLVTEKVLPSELKVAGETPRIGVFVCHCGINIGSVVNVPKVAQYAKTLPNVVYAEENLYTCSQDSQEKIKEKIKEHRLNRVIVASCSPRTHEPLFRATCREAGLNPYLFEMANIRDQCSWVHMKEKDKATEKASDLVRMAVAKANMLEPLYNPQISITQSGLVIGGGLAGMTAALELASLGFEAYLVEKEKELGGNLRNLHYELGAKKGPQAVLAELREKVSSNKKIHVYVGKTVKAIDGFMGNFESTLSDGTKVKHGVIIVATGAKEYKPTEYLYGKDPNVMTQKEAEKKLASGWAPKGGAVMIQCVGSRTPERPYCSRVCCANAIKNALKIKELSPQTPVYVLYKDIRTYGFREEFYREASDKGVRFIRYDDDSKPVVTNSGGLCVKVKDPVLGVDLELRPEALILSAAIIPNEGNEDLAKMIKVPLTKDKFFLEVHMKLRPVEFATEGLYLCGLAHSPKFVDEAISQACGAVARAQTVLSKSTMALEPTLAKVIEEHCDGCAFCVDTCPYKALKLVEYIAEGQTKKIVEVNEAACKGCGVCMATCPKRGIYVRGFKPEMLDAMVDAYLGVKQ